MADTNLQVFVNGIATYLSTNIFPAIVQGMAGKGVHTTVEELMGMTHTPALRAQISPMMQTPTVPAMAFGGAVPTMTPTVAPTTARKTTATAAPVPGKTCTYQFKRGENKGRFCGKATAPGTEYCNGCLKTRKNLQKELAATGTMPGMAPSVGAIPGMTGIPGYNAPNPMVPQTNVAPAQPGSLSVVPYDESRGLFREPNHNFIVYQVSPGVIAVLGRLIDSENKIVALTPQEQQTALSVGLVLAANDAPAVPAVSTVQPVPAVPHAAIPQMPQQVSNQPALPTITPLVQTQQTTGVPMIPGIPQINM